MNFTRRVFTFNNVLFFFLSVVASLLLFLLLYRILPEFGFSYQIERAVILVVLFLLTFLLANTLKWVFVLMLFAISGWLGYNFYYGKQDLLSFYNHSRNVFNDMAGYKDKATYVYTSYSVFYRDRQLTDAISYKDPLVREFALEAANEYFKKEQKSQLEYARVLMQSFAVFKKINHNWNYVSDPIEEEYFAKASESVKLMAGDCDDYSILMASAIKAIGGKVRLTFIKGHIYPELLIGNADDLEKMVPIITKKLFPKETKGKQLHYYTDKNGSVWMNLDYTAKHPGGSYLGYEVVQYIYP